MSHAPTAALKARHHTLRSSSAELGVDALVVTSLPNVAYLTNFEGSAAIVVLTASRLYFITMSVRISSWSSSRDRTTQRWRRCSRRYRRRASVSNPRT
jgi:Xaa-Pro aminopeptidase